MEYEAKGELNAYYKKIPESHGNDAARQSPAYLWSPSDR